MTPPRLGRHHPNKNNGQYKARRSVVRQYLLGAFVVRQSVCQGSSNPNSVLMGGLLKSEF